MALINCKECEKKFSNLAYACPKCGAPTAYSTGTNEVSIQTDTPSYFDLLEAETCNQIMFLIISPVDGKPHIEFIPGNCWVIDSENIVKIIADREGPKKELLPDIIQAAVNRLAKAP
ncbi:hypothetical protein [Acinetobacter lactucae]